MSVYPIEAKPKEIRAEAVERLRLLGLNDSTIREFARYKRCRVSEAIMDSVVLLDIDKRGELKRQIDRFEKEYDSIVYHVIVSHTLFGDSQAFLFVSPQASAWEAERERLTVMGAFQAYVTSDLEEGLADIQVRPEDKGLIRIS